MGYGMGVWSGDGVGRGWGVWGGARAGLGNGWVGYGWVGSMGWGKRVGMRAGSAGIGLG